MPPLSQPARSNTTLNRPNSPSQLPLLEYPLLTEASTVNIIQ